MRDFFLTVFDKDWQKVFAASTAGTFLSVPSAVWIAAIPAALGSIYTLLRIIKYVRDWKKTDKDQ
jgi:hypothetical protein